MFKRSTATVLQSKRAIAKLLKFYCKALLSLHNSHMNCINHCYWCERPVLWLSASQSLPYLRSAIVTLQIMWCGRYAPWCQQTISHLEFLIFKLSNVDNVASPNYNWFFPEPTHNFLDHPNKQHCTVSVRCILPRETANSAHTYSWWTQANKHSCDIICSLSHVLWSVTSHHQWHITRMAVSYCFQAKALPHIPTASF